MTQRQWQAAFASGGLVLLAAWCVQTITLRSASPGNYYQFRNSAEGFVYPIDDIVKWSAGIVTELAIACLAIAYARRVPLACLAVGLTMSALFMALVALAMHAPPYFGGFVLFQLFGSVWAIAASVVTGVWSLVSNTCSARGYSR